MSVLTVLTLKIGADPLTTKPAKEIHTKLDGTWHDCTQVWTKVSGVWQLVFERVNFTNRIVFSGVVGAESEARIRMNTDGTLQTFTTSAGYVTVSEQWLKLPRTNAGNDWKVHATLNSGTLTSGTTGSDLALSTVREWTVLRDSLGTSEAVITLTVSDQDDVNANSLATPRITLRAEWAI